MAMETSALKEIIATEVAVAVYFSAPNCGVCHALKPKVEALFSKEFPAIKFVHVEIDKSPGISGEYSVFSAPTLLVFFEGKEFLRKVRLMSIQELQDIIERPYNLLF
ncbi:MAG TPA: thioredoxin family protein [Aequorivita sp.]|nr:thioredoxin family protein [Aequorivita sp.]